MPREESRATVEYLKALLRSRNIRALSGQTRDDLAELALSLVTTSAFSLATVDATAPAPEEVTSDEIQSALDFLDTIPPPVQHNTGHEHINIPSFDCGGAQTQFYDFSIPLLAESPVCQPLEFMFALDEQSSRLPTPFWFRNITQ
jgi:hypothetical protein